jgi:beta-phosphoglucomutase
MKELKGMIFDMDGVVVDNHKYHYLAWTEFCRRHDFPLTREIYRDRFNGKTNVDIFRIIFDDVTETQIKKYADEKEGLYQEHYRPHMRPLTGLVDFLDYLKQSGFKTALGTSAPPQNVSFILDGLDLRDYFEVIVDGSQVERGKPDPQIYQRCVEKLGLASEECVVFEDSLAGLEAGEGAGCLIIGVATSHTAAELAPKTKLIMPDFSEARKILKI